MPDNDPVAAARAAGLRYVSDDDPGIRRKRTGAKSFTYTTSDGARVRDEATLARIKRLAVPPAWTNVWICPLENGHLQATGRDARGRKQYRYHPRWREVRDETKYGRMIAFGLALPKIRQKTAEHLALPGLPRDKVLATVVRLLELTHIRVGNEEYARQNDSYGLTTMRDHHVAVRGSNIQFRFRGKSGQVHAIDVRDKKLAGVVKRCQSLPGQELFHYVDDDGQPRCIESGDVNEYLRAITDEDFTAKDFRTWAGTVLASVELTSSSRGLGRPRTPPPVDAATKTKTKTKKSVVEAIKRVAARLGNTPAVCRKCYVHPTVLDAYLDGRLAPPKPGRATAPHALRPEEAAVLALLQAPAAEAKGDAKRAA